MNTKPTSTPCDGTFSNLADCNSKLPLNASPTKLSFVQLFPIKKRNKYKSAHLTFQPLNPYLDLTDKDKHAVISKALEFVNGKFLEEANPKKGKPVDGKVEKDLSLIHI